MQMPAIAEAVADLLLMRPGRLTGLMLLLSATEVKVDRDVPELSFWLSQSVRDRCIVCTTEHTD